MDGLANNRNCKGDHYVTHVKPEGDAICTHGGYVACLQFPIQAFYLSDDEFEVYFREKVAFAKMSIMSHRDTINDKRSSELISG